MPGLTEPGRLPPTAYRVILDLSLYSFLQRDSRETVEQVHRGPHRQFSKVSFAYTFHRAATSGSIQYAKKTTENTDTREITTTWSGTAWAANEAAITS